MVDYGGIGGLKHGREINTKDKFEMAVEATLGAQMRGNDDLCKEVWSALANMYWVHPASGDTAEYSFRAAGDLIAAIRGGGDYMDWYCSGPDGVVSERVLAAMGTKGWFPAPDYYG